jgi:peptidoglycan-associated lipoprotein
MGRARSRASSRLLRVRQLRHPRDARPALRNNADKLNAGNLGTVTVEGHCDERGSTEYNLALGERRANAVKRYLVDLGVPSNNLRTVSFGEERPAVAGSRRVGLALQPPR